MLSGVHLESIYDQIEDLCDEVNEDTKIEIVSIRKYVQGGYLDVVCKNNHTAWWLNSVAVQIECPEPLTGTILDAEEKRVKLKARVRNREIQDQLFLARIRNRNPNFDISSWRYKGGAPTNNERIAWAFIEMSESSANILRTQFNNRLKYNIGYIYFQPADNGPAPTPAIRSIGVRRRNGPNQNS